MMCWQRERLERCEEGGSKPASNFWTPGWSKKESVRAFRERMTMTCKHIDLGLLELLGNKVLLLLLPALATLSKLAPEHLAYQVGYLAFAGFGRQWKRQVDIKRNKGKRWRELSSVIMVCMHGACRRSFYLVYAQNKCLELTRQNLMKDLHSFSIWLS